MTTTVNGTTVVVHPTVRSDLDELDTTLDAGILHIARSTETNRPTDIRCAGLSCSSGACPISKQRFRPHWDIQYHTQISICYQAANWLIRDLSTIYKRG